MKNVMKKIAVFLCVAMILSLAGCGGKGTFHHSDSFTKDGFWKNVNAGENVELCDYQAIPVPAETHKVKSEDVESQISSILDSFATTKKVTDRALVDGDTVNIDYVGKIDGVAFQGGNTNGAGTEVTIGVTQYIDDFLEQLIGHKPGETFDIEVTFPGDYHAAELAGNDAVFTVTINFIVEHEEPVLNDEFVSTNLSKSYGWNTVKEFRAGVEEQLQYNAIVSFLQSYLVENCTVKSLPSSILSFHEDVLISEYEAYAEQYQISVDELLQQSFGVADTDAFLEMQKTNNITSSNYALIIQALAEELDVAVDDAAVEAYFSKFYGTSDYSAYETAYGKPYLKWIVVNEKVMDHLIENADLQ